MLPTGEAALAVAPGALTLAPGFNNYYYPQCPAGILGVKRYYRIRYKSIFPFVDQEVYSTAAGLRMVLICHPGFDPNDLLFHFDGQDSMKVDVEGEVRLHLRDKFIEFKPAVAYQLDNNNNVTTLAWGANWDEVNTNGLVSLFFGEYDPTRALMLQIGAPPIPAGGGQENLNEGLDWSTSLGDDAQLATYDLVSGATCHSVDGHLFMTGTHQAEYFPLDPGYFDGDDDYMDTFITRIEYAPGNQAQDAVNTWSTWYGGSMNDKSKAILMNSSNSVLYIGGMTSSPDILSIPTNDPGDGTYWENVRKGSYDGFILKMSPSNGAISRAAYYGGAGNDLISSFVEDGNGQIWFTGTTTSATGEAVNCNSPVSAFPLCDPPGANYWQPNNAGGMDAFLARMDDTFHLNFSTFYGSAADDRAYDMAYYPSLANPGRRIALVGRSLGTVPQIPIANAFQLPGDQYKSGFIATFDGNGQQKWCTNVPRLSSIQGVAFRNGNWSVLGYTHRYFTDDLGLDEGSEPGAPSTAFTCSAVAGSVSICDPGNGAFIDGTNTMGDLYLAEFAPLTGILLYSTYLGGPDEENPSIVFQQLSPLDEDLFDQWKFLDLKVDDQENMYILGTTAGHTHAGPYPVQAAPPFYLRETPANAGWEQSDVTLHLLTSDRHLHWATTFGAWFDHVNDGFDMIHCLVGSDLGAELALAPGKALYWAGCTGNVGFPAQCPYPGSSYCEDFNPFTAGIVQGFSTRMSLQGVGVGVPEGPETLPSSLLGWPSCDNEYLNLAIHGMPVERASAMVHNSLGQLVRMGQVLSGQFVLGPLAAGCYHAQVFSANRRLMGVVSFVITP
jgi:hypothetical protein